MSQPRPQSVPRAPTRPRALLLAEAANPEWVSVPLVGWSLGRALAGVVDAHLVTQVRNRDAIVRAGLVEGRDFTCIDNENVARPLHQVGKFIAGVQGKSFSTITALETVAYYEFERRAWKRFGGEIAAGRFDVVHRITPVSPVMPSPMAARCARVGVPFVIGPLNGGVPWPKGFEALAREDREWLTRVRGLHKLLPAHRATRANAAAILVGSRTAHEEVPERWRDKCWYVPENAVQAARVATEVGSRAHGPLRVVFVGRLVPLKGVDLLLDAVAPLVERGSVVVEIVGDGRHRADLEARARNAGIASGVTFTGWLEHAQVAERLSNAHVLALPSVREFGGGVVLEGMAAGAVPIVLDHGGPPELVSPSTGVAVPLGTRAQVVEGLRAAVARFADDREELARFAAAGLARVARHFTWDAKARRIAEIYRWLLDPTSARPSFPMPIGDEPIASPFVHVTPAQRGVGSG